MVPNWVTWPPAWDGPHPSQRQMHRGVTGNPDTWIAATGMEPVSLASLLARHPATVQEKWFSRLYLVKPLVIGSLALF